MSKIQIVKTTISYATSLTIGAVTSSIISQNRKHSDNNVVETVYDASAIVTGFAVAGMIQDHVAAYTDRKVDEIKVAIDQIKYRHN